MRKIHKLLYSCFGFFMTLAYRNEANGAIVCTYSALSSCSNTGSTWYGSVATAHTAMLNNTVCPSWKHNTLCASGFFVGSCYTDSTKKTKMSESKWDAECSSSAQVDCSSCAELLPAAINVSSSVAVACSVKSKSYTFQLCSSYQIDASGHPFQYGTTAKQRTYTCTETFANGADTVIMRNTDCYVPAGQVVGDVSSGMPTYDFLENCYYTN